MEEFESPTYFLDYQDKSNCSRLLSAKPGGEIAVLVRCEEDQQAPPIKAVGRLSPDGTTFLVKVIVADRVQGFDIAYVDVKDAILYYQEKSQ